MKTMSALLALGALSLASLTGCGESAGATDAAATEEPAAAASGSAAAAAEADAPSGVPAALDAAMRCWGYTQGAAMVRIAAPDRAADLPEVTTEQSGAWFQEASRQAAAAGYTHSQFQALQADYQTSNRLATSARARAEAIEPINACLATLPTDRTPAPDLPEG